jgi:hypothetical protein
LPPRSFEYDLGYLQNTLVELESYLLSDEIFWPVGGSPAGGLSSYPRLTLGGVLLAQARVNAYSITAKREVDKQGVIAEIDRLRSKWRVKWELKAGRCYNTRLRMWGDFLDEYRNNPQDNADRYRYEVRLRVMLHLLGLEGAPTHAEIESLSGLDRQLKSLLGMDGFIWEAEVQSGFSEDIYWYLYGKLPRILAEP